MNYKSFFTTSPPPPLDGRNPIALLYNVHARTRAQQNTPDLKNVTLTYMCMCMCMCMFLVDAGVCGFVCVAPCKALAVPARQVSQQSSQSACESRKCKRINQRQMMVPASVRRLLHAASLKIYFLSLIADLCEFTNNHLEKCWNQQMTVNAS